LLASRNPKVAAGRGKVSVRCHEGIRGTRQRSVIHFMHQSPYPHSQRVATTHWKGVWWAPERATDFGEELKHFALLWIEPRFLVNTTVSLYQLGYPSCLVISMHSCSLKILHHYKITGWSVTLHHVSWLLHWQKCANKQTGHMTAAIMKREACTSHTDKYKTCRLFSITQIPLVSNTKRLVMLHQSNYMLSYAFFWVIPWRLNFICQCFGTLSFPSS